MTALPISGREVALRDVTGAEDLLLLGAHASVPRMVGELLGVLAEEGVDVDELPVGDAEALLLALRRRLLGDTVSADLRCACGARMDLSFSIAEYLRHHQPRRKRGLSIDGEWITSSHATFRIPTLRDQIEVSGQASSRSELLRRCVRGEATRETERKVEALLDRIAPTLSDYVSGSCPECGMAVEVYFDVEQYVMRELRDAAAAVVDDVHLLASRYGWSERDIVLLPRNRRMAYSARIRNEAFA